MAKDNGKYQGGAAGSRKDRPHAAGGWKTPPRDAGKEDYPKTGGKSSGYPLGKTNEERAQRARDKGNGGKSK